MLLEGGWLTLITTSADLRGTTATPESIASRIVLNTFLQEQRAIAAGLNGGFVDARIERSNLDPFARESGVPEKISRSFQVAVAVARRFKGRQLIQDCSGLRNSIVLLFSALAIPPIVTADTAKAVMISV